MNKKIENAINEFFSKQKFLTGEEFEKRIKPGDDMTYKEIKESIFKPEITPESFFTEIKASGLSFMTNPKKTEKGMKMIPFENHPLKQFENAANCCKLNLINAIRDSHIGAKDYKGALFLKIQSMQHALVWWLVMMDKFILVLAYRAKVEIMNGKGANKWAKKIEGEIKEKTIDKQYAEEFKSLMDELNKYRIKHNEEIYTWDGKKFSLRRVANDIKHNQDILTKILDDILCKNLDYSKFESFFYQKLVKDLLIARNKYIDLANRFIQLFEVYVKNCIENIENKEKRMHFFAT